MKRFAVIGHPIAHSRSPAIHQAFAAQAGIALQYERVEAPLDGFAATVARLRETGYAGLNVTLPFKPEALQLAALPSQRASLAGAANTLGWDAAGRLWADNTDGLGLVRDLQHNAGWPLAGREILLLGAGGASSGCLGPLIEARPARIAVWNRSLDRAAALVARHAALAAAQGVELQVIGTPAGSFDAIINGTSAALGGNGLALPNGTGLLRAGGLAVDMVYGQAAEPFLAWARAQPAGCLRDGLGMLVEQAAEAFERWHGQRPDSAPVLAQLREG
jgi:shikimate dehydrogenase